MSLVPHGRIAEPHLGEAAYAGDYNLPRRRLVVALSTLGRDLVPTTDESLFNLELRAQPIL